MLCLGNAFFPFEWHPDVIILCLQKYSSYFQRIMIKTNPVVTLADFLNCSKLDVLAFRSRLFEAVDSASDPESRSRKENTKINILKEKLQIDCKIYILEE